jgi:hypothetical protein
MPKMRELTSVDADYATIGPNQTTLRQPIAVPATTLFNCLANGPAWKEWLGIDVEWTSPEPHGVGTTRTATTTGVTIEEFFLTWDEGERMVFRFDRTTLPMKSFAEHYECTPPRRRRVRTRVELRIRRQRATWHRLRPGVRCSLRAPEQASGQEAREAARS